MKNKVFSFYDFLVPVFWTVCLFLARIPFLDIPNYDDANIYHYGWVLLKGDFHYLDIQWSPLLVLFTAVLNFVFDSAPIPGFFVFQGCGFVLFSLSCTCLFKAAGYQKSMTAFLAIVWSTLFHFATELYPIQVLHLYHFAIPILISAYYLRISPISPIVAFVLCVTAFLVRNEAVILLLPFFVAGIIRRRRAQTPLWNRTWWPVIPLVIPILIVIFIYSCYPENLRWGRMTKAFSQQFYGFALGTPQYPTHWPVCSDPDELTLNAVFTDGAVNRSVFVLFMKNPGAFLHFVWNNTQMLFRDSLFPYYPLFSHFFLYILLFCYLALLIVCIRKKDSFLFCFVVVISLKIPLLLLVVPRFHYLCDIAVLLFFTQWIFITPQKAKWISLLIVALLLPAVIYSVPQLLHTRNMERQNIERAKLLATPSIRTLVDKTLLSETYAPFTYTFGARNLKDSVGHANLVAAGDRLIYGITGAPVDFLLVQNIVPIPLPVFQWLAKRNPIVESGHYRLYSQSDISPLTGSFPPVSTEPITVCDDVTSSIDLSFRQDLDNSNERCLVLRWDYNQLEINPADIDSIHIYVKTNCQENKRYLGKQLTPSLSCFEWKPGSPYTDISFTEGPQFDTVYWFSIYLLPKDSTQKIFGPYTHKGPVQFLQTSAN